MNITISIVWSIEEAIEREMNQRSNAQAISTINGNCDVHLLHRTRV